MAPARPIALLTDFGSTDFYAGVMRAVLATRSPASRVLDIHHDLPAHDIAQASFVLARVFPYLPPDAVIVAIVDPGVGSERRGLVLEFGQRTLVTPDNGTVSDLLTAGASGPAFALDPARVERLAGAATRGATFHGRDVFAPVAAALARGAAAAELGVDAGGLVRLRDVPSVSVEGTRVTARGRYLDHFGTVFSDIPVTLIAHVFAERASRVRARVNGVDAGPLRRTYADARPGELVALVNSWDLVEVAAVNARASDVLRVDTPAAVGFELAEA